MIVLGIWNKSPAVENNGLKKGDVILMAAGKPVKNVKDFFTINQNLQKGEKLEVVVMRNQAEKILSIKTE